MKKITLVFFIFLTSNVHAASTPKNLLGAWRLTDVVCSKGALSETGKRYLGRIKSQQLIVYYTFHDSKGGMSSRSYTDPADTSNYCVGSSEEKLIFGKAKGQYQIANTALKYRQDGKETPSCRGDFKNPDKRTQKYQLEGDVLKLQADYEWHPGKSKEAAKAVQACPEGEYIRIYKKAAKEEYP